MNKQDTFKKLKTQINIFLSQNNMQLNDLINKLDKENKGYISINKFILNLRNDLNIILDNHEILEVLRELDRKQTEEIYLSEFKNLIKSNNPREKIRIQINNTLKKLNVSIDQIINRWEIIDSGNITIEQFFRLLDQEFNIRLD